MARSAKATWGQLLDTTTVGDLLGDAKTDRRVIAVPSDATVGDALAALRDHGVLSVLVYDAKSQPRRYTGFVDALDIVAGASVIAHVKQFVDALGLRPSATISDDELLSREHDALMTQPIGPVCDTSGRNALHIVPAAAPLVELLRGFARDPNTHRVAVADADDTVIGVVSQSRVIAWLADHANARALPEALARVSAADVRGCSVTTVERHTRTLDAFTAMLEARASAVGIVDKADGGRLVGVLSASDIKRSLGGGANLFRDLELDVLSYVTLAPPPPVGTSTGGGGGGAAAAAGAAGAAAAAAVVVRPEPRYVLSVTPVTVCVGVRIVDVLRLLCAHSIHRLFVVDGAATRKPIAVLALYDLLACFDAFAHLETFRDTVTA